MIGKVINQVELIKNIAQGIDIDALNDLEARLSAEKETYESLGFVFDPPWKWQTKRKFYDRDLKVIQAIKEIKKALEEAQNDKN